jgi:hypothetical protein
MGFGGEMLVIFGDNEWEAGAFRGRFLIGETGIGKKTPHPKHGVAAS